MISGDSIVIGQGNTGPGGGDVGWRLLVQQAAAAAGTPIFMVGPLSTGDAIADPWHDGTFGMTILTLTTGNSGTRVATTMGPSTPDIFIADAGVNDMAAGAATVASRASTWLDQIWAAASNGCMRILLFNVLPVTFDMTINATITAYNALLPAIVAGKSFASRVTLFDQASLINPNTDLTDGLHPNPTGYGKLATGIWSGVLGSTVGAVMSCSS